MGLLGQPHALCHEVSGLHYWVVLATPEEGPSTTAKMSLEPYQDSFF